MQITQGELATEAAQMALEIRFLNKRVAQLEAQAAEYVAQQEAQKEANKPAEPAE